MAEYKPIKRIKAVVDTYTDKDGKKKNRYADIGVVMSSPHGSNQFGKIESLPRDLSKWDGRIYFDPIKSKDDAPNQSADIAPEDIDDKPIDLSEIPF